MREAVIVSTARTPIGAAFKGARQVGHVLLEGRRCGVKYLVTSMCVGGGMGAAALFEVA